MQPRHGAAHVAPRARLALVGRRVRPRAALDGARVFAALGARRVVRAVPALRPGVRHVGAKAPLPVLRAHFLPCVHAAAHAAARAGHGCAGARVRRVRGGGGRGGGGAVIMTPVQAVLNIVTHARAFTYTLQLIVVIITYNINIYS